MPLFQPPPPNPVVSATGAQPNAPNKIAAALTVNVVVTTDNPPGFTQQVPYWEDDPPLPILPRYYPQEGVAGKVPFIRKSAPDQWFFPPDLTVYYLRRPPYTEGTAAPAQADNPPGYTAQVPYWEDDPPLPTLPRYYPQAGTAVVVEQVPFARVWMTGIVQAWQPPPPFPQLPREMAPGIPGQSVDNPPGFPPDVTWMPVDVYYPTLPRLMSPAIPGMSVDNPPRFRPWQSPLPLDVPFPQLPREMSPGIPGQSVDNPPPLKVRRQPDQEPAPPIILPEKMSPGIPGMSVDNPPRLARQPLPRFDDVPLPTLQRPYPQPFVQVAQQTPFSPAWLSTVLQAWQAGDIQVLRRLLNPSFLAVRVDDPPFDRRHLEDFLRQWQPPDPPPTRPRFMPAGLLGVGVDNPPFDRRHFENWLTAWLPPDPMPTIPRRLTPPSVDNPPLLKRFLQQYPDAALLPQLPRYYPQEFVAAAQPFVSPWMAIILAAWAARDPDIIRQLKLTPGIPGVSVDNPPRLLRLQQPSFEPVPFQVLPVRATVQGAAAQPFIDAWLSTVLQAWVSDPAIIRQFRLNPDLLGVQVNNPPFSMGGRNELANIINQWPLDKWLIRQVTLNPDLLAVAVNNPPFSHLGRNERDAILAMWRDPRWDLWITQKLAQIIQEGPTPPPGPSERFTVSGPTVEDLFGPIGDVSHNWGGGTQKRTV